MNKAGKPALPRPIRGSQNKDVYAPLALTSDERLILNRWMMLGGWTVRIPGSVFRRGRHETG